MIPQDVLKRLTTAHDNAVAAARTYEASSPRSKTEKKMWDMYQRAEGRFEAALAALVDAAAERREAGR